MANQLVTPSYSMLNSGDMPQPTKPNPSDLLSNLSPLIYITLKQVLNCTHADKNWKTLLDLITSYFKSILEFPGFAPVSITDGGVLLRRLMSLNFTVREFTQLLDVIEYEEAAKLLQDEQPILILDQPPREVKANDGDVVRLICEATGFPYPKYQWYRGYKCGKGDMRLEKVCGDNNVSYGKGRELRLKVYSRDNNTYIICRVYRASLKVKNEETDVYTQPCLLDITTSISVGQDNKHSKCVIYKSPPSQLHVSLGHSFELPCYAIAELNSILYYQWTKDDIPIPHYQTANNSILAVKDAAVEDAGRYVCVVLSNFGETKSEVCDVTILLEPGNVMCLHTDSPPLIIRQPVAPHHTVNPLSTFKLSCLAVGYGGYRTGITYQWYKNGNALVNSVSSDLELTNITDKDSGYYHCEVSNNFGSVKSDFVRVQVNMNLKSCGKLALLIGNYDYTGLNDQLGTPRNDIFIIGDQLRQLGFLVFSLINLNKEEMLDVITYFCSLLISGMYVVIYFSGHGFECNNECYLVPIDATKQLLDECISESSILSQMQTHAATSLNLLLLDTCRTLNESIRRQVSTSPPVQTRKAYERANVIVGYATCSKWEAYEGKNAQHSVFATHLKEHIMKPQPFPKIFQLVQEDIKKAGYKFQRPIISIALPEPVSLTDTVLPEEEGGMGQKLRTEIKNILGYYKHVEIVTIPDLSLSLTIRPCFTNVLAIQVEIMPKKPGYKNLQITNVSNLPDFLSCEIDENSVYIHNLQKLKKPLEPELLMEGIYDGREVSVTIPCGNLGLPLIARRYLNVLD